MSEPRRPTCECTPHRPALRGRRAAAGLVRARPAPGPRSVWEQLGLPAPDPAELSRRDDRLSTMRSMRRASGAQHAPPAGEPRCCMTRRWRGSSGSPCSGSARRNSVRATCLPPSGAPCFVLAAGRTRWGCARPALRLALRTHRAATTRGPCWSRWPPGVLGSLAPGSCSISTSTRLAVSRRPPVDERDRAGTTARPPSSTPTRCCGSSSMPPTALRGVFAAAALPPQLVTDDVRGLPAYSALQQRVVDEVRDRRRANPFAALVRLETKVGGHTVTTHARRARTAVRAPRGRGVAVRSAEPRRGRRDGQRAGRHRGPVRRRCANRRHRASERTPGASSSVVGFGAGKSHLSNTSPT